MKQLLSNLQEGNWIGSGAAGRVYKVLPPDGHVVTVQRVRCQVRAPGSRHAVLGLVEDVETLGMNARHRNIVMLLRCCSNSDSNSLVYEYIRLGNLKVGSAQGTGAGGRRLACPSWHCSGRRNCGKRSLVHGYVRLDNLRDALQEELQLVVHDWPVRHFCSVRSTLRPRSPHHPCAVHGQRFEIAVWTPIRSDNSLTGRESIPKGTTNHKYKWYRVQKVQDSLHPCNCWTRK